MEEIQEENFVYVREEIKVVNYDYYLPYRLEDTSAIVEICQRLRTMTENDSLVIHINCLGGMLDIALMIRAAIKECSGTVIGSIEGECASAASLVFLSCSAFRVAEFGRMMIHAPSWGSVGKHNEVKSSYEFTQEYLEDVTRGIYKNFLTEEEITNILAASDVYLGREEILQRLHRMVDKLNEENEED